MANVDNWPEAPPNTLVCLLCRGVVPCGMDTTDKYLGHLRNDHNAYFHLDLLLKINMLDRSVVEMLCKAEVTNPKLAPLQAKIKEEPQQQQQQQQPQTMFSSQSADQSRPVTPSYPRPTTPSYIKPPTPTQNYVKPPTPNYARPPKAPSPNQFTLPTLTEEPVHPSTTYSDTSNYDNFETSVLKNQSVSLRSANIKVSGIANNDEDDDEDMSESSVQNDEASDDVDKILEGFRARLKGFPADQIAESMGIDGTKKANFACYECGQSFTLAVELKLHKLSHAGSKGQIKCDICQEEFKQRTAMDQHKRTVHTEDRPYQCPVCPKNYAKSAELKLHNFAHTGETPFSCDLCPATFNRPANLRRHKINHQRNNSLSGKRSSIFSCDICTLRFPDALALKCHTEVHGIGENAQTGIIICKVCAKTFASASNLKEHMLTHNGQTGSSIPSPTQSNPPIAPTPLPSNPIPTVSTPIPTNPTPIPTNPSSIPTPEHVACDVCSARFLRQDQLTRHKSMEHNTQTPQTCKECGKTFSRTKALQMHTYLHTGDTNFSCTNCEETFTHSVTYTTHFERTHGAGSPSFYNCAKCGVTFSKSQSRDKHQNLDLCPKY